MTCYVLTLLHERFNSSDKDIIGVSKNEYEYLKVNNNLKQNTLYVITDDND